MTYYTTHIHNTPESQEGLKHLLCLGLCRTRVDNPESQEGLKRSCVLRVEAYVAREARISRRVETCIVESSLLSSRLAHTPESQEGLKRLSICSASTARLSWPSRISRRVETVAFGVWQVPRRRLQLESQEGLKRNATRRLRLACPSKSCPESQEGLKLWNSGSSTQAHLMWRQNLKKG